MKRFARICDGVVAEVLDVNGDVGVDDLFHRDLATSLVACDQHVYCGMIYENGRFATVPVEDQVSDERFASAVKDECRRRILAVASSNTQINMIAAVAAGILSEAERSSYSSAVEWVGDMRRASTLLISNKDNDFRDESKWPPIPEHALALCKKF